MTVNVVASTDDATMAVEPLLPPPIEKPQKLTVDSSLRMKWYTFRVLLLAEFVLLGSAGNMVYMTYAAATPKTVSCIGPNITIADLCKEHPNDWKNLDCDPIPHYEFRSLNVEFNHLCGETALVKSSLSVQMAGVLVGAMFWGHISDTRGRKAALVPTFTLMTLLSIACTFTWDLMSFTIVRTVLSFFNGGALGVYGVYKIEHLPHKHRFLIVSLIAWSPNFLIVNGLAYLAGDWRTFQYILCAISSPAFICFFFIYESPRFLIQRGRLVEARQVMARMQEIDGVSDAKKEDMNRMIDDEHERMLQREKKTKRYNIFHLFKYKELAVPTLVFSFGILFTSMTSYGIMFFIDALSGSLYLNSMYLGIMRWSINIIVGISDYNFLWITRRVVHTVTLSITVIMLSTIVTIRFLGLADQFTQVVRICTLITSACCSQIFITKGMTSMEFYPTPLRNSASSFQATFARVGNIFAPLLFFHIPTHWLYACLCCLAVVDCIVFFLVIPETKGRPLSEKLPGEREEDERGPRNEPLQLVKSDKNGV